MNKLDSWSVSNYMIHLTNITFFFTCGRSRILLLGNSSVPHLLGNPTLVAHFNLDPQYGTLRPCIPTSRQPLKTRHLYRPSVFSNECYSITDAFALPGGILHLWWYFTIGFCKPLYHQLISLWTIWLPFRRRYIQMYFREWKGFLFWMNLHWSLFLRVHLTMTQHWFR